MRVALAGLLLSFPTVALTQGLPRWTLVEELRIGSADGPQAITTPHGLVLSRDGHRAYVAHRSEHLIRVFDAATGKLLRTIGRPGAGPGEFRNLSQIGWKGDTLFVADVQLQHVSLFTAAGEHLRTDRFNPASLQGSGGRASLVAYLSDGTAIGAPLISISAAIAGQQTRKPWVQMTQTGQTVRVVAEEDLRGAFMKIQVAKAVIMGRRPLSEALFVEVAPDGSSIVIVSGPPSTASPARFRVTRVSATGDTLYHRAYQYTPRPVTAALVDSLYDGYALGLGRMVPKARALAAVKEQLVLPKVHPAVSDVVVSADGSAWLRREELASGSVNWLVLDPAGHVQAVVPLPKDTRILSVNGGTVWGEVRDELDVPYLIRFRVAPAPRSTANDAHLVRVFQWSWR